MAIHPSILAWKISWTEEPGGLQSMGSQRVGHDWATNILTHSSTTERQWSCLSLSLLYTLLVVQLLSCVQLVPTSWTAAHQAPLSSTISRSLLKYMSTESVMLSKHPASAAPLLLLPSIFPSIGVLSSELALCIRWPKYQSFSFTISPFNEYSGLICFTSLGLISLQSKGLSRGFSSTTIWKHQLFSSQPFLAQLSHLYLTTGKTTALTVRTIVGKVMSLLFNTLSRLLLSSKEQVSSNLMAEVTVHSDFLYPPFTLKFGFFFIITLEFSQSHNLFVYKSNWTCSDSSFWSTLHCIQQ